MNVIATPTAGRRPGLDEGDQRHRHDAAAGGVPEGSDGAPARRRSRPRGLRLQPARPRALHRGHRRQGPAAAAAGARTRSRSRGTSAGSPGAVPTSTSRCCASRTSSGRASAPRSPTTSACPSSRPCWASTAGSSSCTRTTASRRCGSPPTGPTTGIVNVAGDGVLMLSQAARLAGRPALPVPPALSGVGGHAVPPHRPHRLQPEQIRFLSYGRGLDTTRMRACSASSRATPPGRPSRTSSAAAALQRTPLAGRQVAVRRGAAPRWAATVGRAVGRDGLVSSAARPSRFSPSPTPRRTPARPWPTCSADAGRASAHRRGRRIRHCPGRAVRLRGAGRRSWRTSWRSCAGA